MRLTRTRAFSRCSPSFSHFVSTLLSLCPYDSFTMGSTASKPARKLARTPPAWAGARTPNTGAQVPPWSAMPQASETKNEAIEKDSKDPHLLANLSRLGQVQVDHRMQSVKPEADHTQRLFQTRLRSEDEARSARPSHNQLVAASLMDLLEERTFAHSRSEQAGLANKYGIDPEKLERLARYVNSASVSPDSIKRWVSEDGAEHTSMLASWKEPKIKEDKPLPTSL
ncbi:hypothetical protein BC628DRAFT_728899 [Trametes gibbosa]|nr:hypothetical protein BC628DRAFT_728899 [Trametes gibbosa]